MPGHDVDIKRWSRAAICRDGTAGCRPTASRSKGQALVSSNDLVVGSPRLGRLIDGDERTPEVAVLLEDTGGQVQVVVLTGGVASRDPYERWFSGSQVMYGDDPERVLYAYKPPRVAMFYDVNGPVALVGCRAGKARSSMTGGRGVVEVDFAVLGARHMNYEKINGVRVEMPGLSPWTRMKSVHVTPSAGSDGRVRNLEVRLEAPDAVHLSRRVNLGLRPTWRTSRSESGGTFEAHDVVELMTATQRPRAWVEHLDTVLAVRELMCLSAWKPLGFTKVAVNRGDDPQRVLSGDAIGERWAQVVSYRFPTHQDWVQEPNFLFYFPEIGSAGVRRWLRLRRHFSRAFKPLVEILDQEDAFVSTRLVQTGIALEALGYQLLLDAGAVPPNKRLVVKYHEALDAVLGDMAHIPLDDQKGWKDRSSQCYRGVKHADNSLPGTLDLLNTYRENVLVLRYWLAARMGLDDAALKARLEDDPLGRPWVAAE